MQKFHPILVPDNGAYLYPVNGLTALPGTFGVLSLSVLPDRMRFHEDNKKSHGARTPVRSESVEIRANPWPIVMPVPILVRYFGCDVVRRYGLIVLYPGNFFAASSLDTAAVMITSPPCFQLAGVATECLAVS
jgi:hypothetical protein